MSGPFDRPLLAVGRIQRAHGIRGEVRVDLWTDRTERLDPGGELLAGERVLTVATSRSDRGRWLVRFTGVDDRTSAEALSGVELLAAVDDDPDDDTLWIHQLIGSAVAETDGVRRGSVVEVLANPAADLLVLDDGHLVPVTFVTDFRDGVVTIDPPDGLFDL